MRGVYSRQLSTVYGYRRRQWTCVGMRELTGRTNQKRHRGEEANWRRVVRFDGPLLEATTWRVRQDTPC